MEIGDWRSAISAHGLANSTEAASCFLRCTLYLILLLAACQSDNTAWERIQETGILRVGLDPTYPPFEVADETGLRGLDVDLAQAIAADLGLEVGFVYFGYDGLYDALATEQVDVLISALVVAPERTRDFAYSEPYFNAGEILIVPELDTEIRGMADLDGRTLAVELGAQGHVEAIDWQHRLPDLTVNPYNTADEALAAIARGEADAALVDAISGRLFLANQPTNPSEASGQAQPTLRRTSDVVTVEPFALVVRIEDELLLEKLNESLDRLRAAGRLDEITNHWLGR